MVFPAGDTSGHPHRVKRLLLVVGLGWFLGDEELVPVKDRFLVRGEEILATLEERTSPLVVTILPTRPTLGLPRDRENVIPDDPTGSGVVSEDPTGSTLVGAGGVGGCHSEC
tara:strand:- start:3056 stop:3391 length:336 start_codon:yes stop_codon:yes gene_type:complete